MRTINHHTPHISKQYLNVDVYAVPSYFLTAILTFVAEELSNIYEHIASSKHDTTTTASGLPLNPRAVISKSTYPAEEGVAVPVP